MATEAERARESGVQLIGQQRPHEDSGHATHTGRTLQDGIENAGSLEWSTPSALAGVGSSLVMAGARRLSPPAHRMVLE